MNSVEKESAYFFPTYKRIPLEIERGEGVFLFTKDGTKYLDLFGGLAVNALGYAHPGVLKAINDQASKYIHLSNSYLQEPQIRLAELLIKHSGYSKVFFTNSGTEGIEGALKITRKWGSKQGKTDIIAFSNGFHGRTMGALSIMDKVKYRKGYEPFLPNCHVIEFNNISALRKAVNEQTAAIVFEPIQGEGGISPVHSDIVEEINVLQNKLGFLIVADEIQSGLGRTGKFFGFQHYALQPDIVVIAKPLGGGLPLGAILGGNRVSAVLEQGVHGTTFGGNPVACAAGIVVLDEIMNKGVMANAQTTGNIFYQELLSLQREFPSFIKEVRGFGLMIGMELTRECESVVSILRDKNILLNCTNTNVLRFLPPLILQKEHITTAIKALRSAFSSFR